MTGAVIIVYVALLVVIGLYSARQVRSERDYLVAGRRLGPIVLGATLPATQLSAGTAIGTVGYIALYGYQYNWFWVALWTGWLVSMLFVAPKMHEFGRTHDGMTIPDIVGARFGRSLRFVVALIIVVAFLLLFSAEYQGAATVFNLVFGISYIPAVLISAVVVGVYSLSGGLFSVARNDVLQMVVFVAGYVAAAVYALHAAGGAAGLQHRLSARHHAVHIGQDRAVRGTAHHAADRGRSSPRRSATTSCRSCAALPCPTAPGCGPNGWCPVSWCWPASRSPSGQSAPWARSC
jgi:Na+/proline symporter